MICNPLNIFATFVKLTNQKPSFISQWSPSLWKITWRLLLKCFSSNENFKHHIATQQSLAHANNPNDSIFCSIQQSWFFFHKTGRIRRWLWERPDAELRGFQDYALQAFGLLGRLHEGRAEEEPRMGDPGGPAWWADVWAEAWDVPGIHDEEEEVAHEGMA